MLLKCKNGIYIDFVSILDFCCRNSILSDLFKKPCFFYAKILTGFCNRISDRLFYPYINFGDIVHSVANNIGLNALDADVNITYNVYVHLYGDGFDEMYAAIVSEK